MNKNLFIIILIVISLIFTSIIFKDSTNRKAVNNLQSIVKAELALEKNQSLVVFDSKSPFSFNNIFNGLTDFEDQTVFGVLTLPKINQNKKFPLIIGVAGSMGWRNHHYEYMNQYLDNGFAVFALHSFKSRNVNSTVGSQVKVTTPMIIHDVYMALNKLSKNPSIQAENIGITGWSLGGGVALFSGWTPIQSLLSPNLKFKAHLPIYPPCMVHPDDLNFTDAPIHILIGEDDNWVPAEACIELIEKMPDNKNISITVYPDAHHSFDSNKKIREISHSYSFSDCRLRLSDDGVVRMNKTGFPLSTPALQKIGLAFCAARGTTVGQNLEAKRNALEFSLNFMKKHLNNNQ